MDRLALLKKNLTYINDDWEISIVGIIHSEPAAFSVPLPKSSISFQVCPACHKLYTFLTLLNANHSDQLITGSIFSPPIHIQAPLSFFFF